MIEDLSGKNLFSFFETCRINLNLFFYTFAPTSFKGSFGAKVEEDHGPTIFKRYL